MKIHGNRQVVCSGWSPSGVYHIGNSREAVTCNAINIALQNEGADSKFIFVIDDYDPLDKIPAELKKYTNDLRPHLGHPLITIPDFTGETKNYARYFSQGPEQALKDWGFDVEFIYASNLYKNGKYDEFLDIYLETEEHLQTLIENISGSPLSSLITIECKNCGNLKTTQILEFTMEQTFRYQCKSVNRYTGCDYVGELNIKEHNWKLRWRLDWPARQSFLGVTVEPSGKDHSVAGGSIDTALGIHQQIFRRKPPLLLKYGFITLKGKKFSGSKGGALAANKLAEIMPSSAYLYLIYRSDLLKDISFNPQSDEYGSLLDEFDIARRMLNGEKFDGREREVNKLSMAAKLALKEEEWNIIPGKVKFNELVLIHQSSLLDLDKTISKLQNMNKLVDNTSIIDLKHKLPLIERWIDELAPDNIKFTILKQNPVDIEKHWTKDIQTLWISTLTELNDDSTPDDFNKLIREKATNMGLKPQNFFPPFYQLIVGSKRGPNASNLVYAIGRDEILNRIKSIKI